MKTMLLIITILSAPEMSFAVETDRSIAGEAILQSTETLDHSTRIEFVDPFQKTVHVFHLPEPVDAIKKITASPVKNGVRYFVQSEKRRHGEAFLCDSESGQVTDHFSYMKNAFSQNSHQFAFEPFLALYPPPELRKKLAVFVYDVINKDRNKSYIGTARGFPVFPEELVGADRVNLFQLRDMSTLSPLVWNEDGTKLAFTIVEHEFGLNFAVVVDWSRGTTDPEVLRYAIEEDEFLVDGAGQKFYTDSAQRLGFHYFYCENILWVENDTKLILEASKNKWVKPELNIPLSEFSQMF